METPDVEDCGMDWQREIDELHQCFEAWFLGSGGDLDRVERALGPSFTFVGPDGVRSDRSAVIAQIDGGRAHTDALVIRITDHRLITATDDVVVAEYIEHHDLADRSNHRRSTVVFDVDPDGPNGLRWRHVQETWCDGDS